MSQKIYETTLAGRPLRIEIGQFAQLANGACMVRYGDTVVLSSATASQEPRPGIDFFPLSVDYEEKAYAAGKFPGGFIKREGRPSENAVLTSRAIDRPLRPLFPKDLRNDVHVNNLVMSVDQDNEPEIAAMLGSSIAVAISDIPWNGPTASVALGLVDGEVVVCPNVEERAKSDMYVTLAGTEKKICMIEAGANEVPDELMLKAIEEGHKVIRELCQFINSIVSECGKAKFTYPSALCPKEVVDKVRELVGEQMKEAVLATDKTDRDDKVQAIKIQLKETFEAQEDEVALSYLGEAIDKLSKETVRNYLFKSHRRVDGRALDEIRSLSCGTSILPRVHGSAFFQRGQTQAITICTLAPMAQAQTLDGLGVEDEKRYMHHYNFPGYSVGEAKPNRSPGRREIGHGALSERSLLAVLPSVEEFPYAIRNVSEITMSNGSTSQASVCASTLALMDAGVPIKRPVAGISSGLIVNPENDEDYLVFMDIQGIEDFYGDMDFKVAGTTEGITSIQVDIKVDGLTIDIIRDAFAMTRKGRLQIINDVMLPCMPEPRKELSLYAPKIVQMSIPVDKIREVIGQGGKVINKIIALTTASIDIEEDGTLYLSAVDPNGLAAAKKMIEGIINDPEPGDTFTGTVTRLMAFGAFVEYAPGKEGLVHISKMAWERVESVEDVVSVGDEVEVKVLEIDDQGRINLSMRDTQEKPEGYEPPAERPSRSRDDRPRRSFSRDRDNREGGRSHQNRSHREHRDHGDRQYEARPRARRSRNSD